VALVSELSGGAYLDEVALREGGVLGGRALVHVGVENRCRSDDREEGERGESCELVLGD
jgi:hypothetical protein